MKKSETNKCKKCLYADMCQPLPGKSCDYYVSLNENEEEKLVIRRQRNEFRDEWYRYTKDDRD